MELHTIDLNDSIAGQFLAELRNVEVQQDRLRFRRNMERMGEILAYEMSKSLAYVEKTISTPLTETQVKVLAEQPVLIPILRAAVPFFDGVLNYFDQADAGFIGAYRANDFISSGDIQLGYSALPDIENRILVLIDPMLATGTSLVDTASKILAQGKPKHIHIITLIATPAGLDKIKNELTMAPTDVWCGAIDKELNDKAYIVPGLGDAGDLAYGTKL
jgi:uracil phosphoribosyltransferase